MFQGQFKIDILIEILKNPTLKEAFFFFFKKKVSMKNFDY